ncbi:phosphopantetheine-binding protein [Catenulispora pinisilvae]|uniref:phosphopantetheine-binding protein n=1 Tax=Catenulispora pinisilvae TaxID=2705253 RepID=UPI001891C14B|nr:phosphopantetheine-binding protein [Catenulispora pinisilvae]
MTTQQSLMRYIADTWMDGDSTGLDADSNLVELNVIDSAAIFDLVHHLQVAYKIKVPLPEVTPDNFRSVKAIAALVDQLRGIQLDRELA